MNRSKPSHDKTRVIRLRAEMARSASPLLDFVPQSDSASYRCLLVRMEVDVKKVEYGTWCLFGEN